MNGFLSSKVGYEEYLWAPLWRLRPRNTRPEILNEGSNTTRWVQPSSGGTQGIHNNEEKCPSLVPHTCYTCVLGQAGVNPHSPCQTASVFEAPLPVDPPAVLLSDLKRTLSPTDPA